MRGKDANCDGFDYFNGITPAYAGKSIRLSSYGLKGWDHPRLCGEKFVKNDVLTIAPGSPPPMRGKGRLRWQKSLVDRITPAYAGKS